MGDWYVISNVDRIDSPALAFYPDRISGNIELAKRIIGDTNRLRPHVKTNKAAEVSRMLLDAESGSSSALRLPRPRCWGI